MDAARKRALVIGGAGRLGRVVVRHLLRAGWAVRVLDLQPYKGDDSVDVRIGSMLDASKLRECLEGVHCVLHLASHIDIRPYPSPLLRKVNVDGTALIVQACRDNGVKALVYTSSIDVLVDGTEMRGGAFDDVPASRNLPNPYSTSKADAERLVLAANGADLATCALRPGHIYGPEDILYLKSFIGKRYAAPFRISPPTDQPQPKLSFINLDNCAHAHVLAANQLAIGSPAAGQAFIITEGTALNVFDYVTASVDGIMRPQAYRVSPWIMLLLAYVVELVNFFLSLLGLPQLLLTRGVLFNIIFDAYCNYDKASRILGYQPVRSFEDAFKEARSWLHQHIALST